MNKRQTGLLAAAVSVAALVLAGCGGGDSESGGKTKVVVWNGYEDAQGKNLTALIAQYNKDHPDVDVTQLVSSSDRVLQKVLTAVRGGSPPDVAYMFGSWSPNIAKIPQVVDMSSYVDDPDWKWDDFYEGEREAATVGDKVVGVPALVDNLAIVYNKTLFKEAGVAPPTADWTWDDFRDAAKKLTDPAKKQYGWAYRQRRQRGHGVALPRDAVAGRRRPAQRRQHRAGLRLRRRGRGADDAAGHGRHRQVGLPRHHGNGNYLNLFNSGKIAMLWTGPWDLLEHHPTSTTASGDADLRRLQRQPRDDLRPGPLHACSTHSEREQAGGRLRHAG